MSDSTYEELRKRISEHLSAGIRDFGKAVGDISRNFRSLGLETAVWYPEKIHSSNLGGIAADSYFGYSRIEGKWGLLIRTIERDNESGSFVGQRVYAIETCRNMEIVVNALKKARDSSVMSKAADRQLETLSKLDDDINALRDPECKF